MDLTTQEDSFQSSFIVILHLLEHGLAVLEIRRLEGKIFLKIKLNRNYGPSIKASRKSHDAYDCDQVLWLIHDHITEVGTMNFLCFWKNEQGEDELITPPLDGTILPGVTRDSILTLARELNQFKVTERPFKIHELVKACK